jgi:hypothetical protein
MCVDSTLTNSLPFAALVCHLIKFKGGMCPKMLTAWVMYFKWRHNHIWYWREALSKIFPLVKILAASTNDCQHYKATTHNTATIGYPKIAGSPTTVRSMQTTVYMGDSRKVPLEVLLLAWNLKYGLSK